MKITLDVPDDSVRRAIMESLHEGREVTSRKGFIEAVKSYCIRYGTEPDPEAREDQDTEWGMYGHSANKILDKYL